MGSNPPSEPSFLPNPHLVFISDASAEAERIGLVLRAQGYGVVDVPLALLVGRLALQRPALLLLDADADGAAPTFEVLSHSEEPVPLILFTTPGGLWHEIPQTQRPVSAATFDRPVQVPALLERVAALIGRPEGRVPAHSLPPSMRSPVLVTGSHSTPMRPHPIAARPSEPAETSPSAPPAAPDLDVAPEGPAQAALAHAALSADILELLRDAERRVGAAPSDAISSREGPSPEEDVDAALPADVLDVLDEPLEDDEGDSSRGFEEGGPRGGEDTGATTGRGTSDPPNEGHLTPAPVGSEVGTAVTEGGGPFGNPRTSIESHPPQSKATEEPEPPQAVQEARQRAPTPKPPRAGGTQAGDSEPPPTPRPRAFTEPPRTQLEPTSFSDNSAPPRSLAGRMPSPSAPAPPPPSTDRPPASRTGSFAQTTPPSRPRSELPLAATTEDMALPAALSEGETIRAVAQAVRGRFTGGLAFEVDEGIRRIVLRDGDFVTAASGVHGESLVAFLVDRGDLPGEAAREAHKLATFGRHAGAALIAQGYLAQDQLWVVLRAHAEWIVGQVLRMTRGSARAESELPGRLQEEPAVFGGATGAEVLIEIVRRIVSPDSAAARLGGWSARLGRGTGIHLLGECALPTLEQEIVSEAQESPLAQLVDRSEDPSFAAAIYALSELGVLSVFGGTRDTRSGSQRGNAGSRDPLDDEAIREKIRARKALVDHGDYFMVLGVPRAATGYEIRRAYTTLRREFEPSRLLTSGTADLRDDVDEIVEVLEEAYDILRDQVRRDRYCRAIEATP